MTKLAVLKAETEQYKSVPMDMMEVRSDELQEIIGKVPHWIVRWGITVVFSVILLLFIGAWFFTYPDIVPASITITTTNPPAILIARTSGKISRLFVQDSQSVTKDTYLCLLENAADYHDIEGLKTRLDRFRAFLQSEDIQDFAKFNVDLILGDVQPSYENFTKNLSDYQHYVEIKYYAKKILLLEEEIRKQQAYQNQLNEQVTISNEDLQMAEKQLHRAEYLFKSGVISNTELENARAYSLEKKKDVEGAKMILFQSTIQIGQIEQQLADLRLLDIQQREQMRMALRQSHENLQNALRQWEHLYVLKSPIAGRVVFNKFWAVTQNVVAGEKVLSVVPKEKTELRGRALLPLQGSGKVKVGQRVRIKLSNYPFMEFGIIWGEIRVKSEFPVDNFFVLDVFFPEGLKTNYGKTLEFNQDMQGVAEIITDNKRLLTRFLSPFKLLLQQNG